MNKIKKNDKVVVISGKDRGRSSKVLAVLPKKRKIIVDKINLITKHIRPKKQGEKGQRVQIPAPFDWSNVKLICPKCSQPTRVGFKLLKNKKVRICKKCNKNI